WSSARRDCKLAIPPDVGRPNSAVPKIHAAKIRALAANTSHHRLPGESEDSSLAHHSRSSARKVFLAQSPPHTQEPGKKTGAISCSAPETSGDAPFDPVRAIQDESLHSAPRKCPPSGTASKLHGLRKG